MDAALLDQLEKEHRLVEQIFAKLEKAEEESEQRELVQQLTAALSEHMKVEEQQVYPELQRIDGEMSEEAQTEHDLARDGVSKLEQLIGQPGFGAAVAMCKAGIEHHVEEEEEELFPKVSKLLSADELEALAGEMTATQVELEEARSPREAVRAETDAAASLP